VISSASTPAAAAADPASAVAAEPSRATSYALAYDAASDAALDALAALAPGDDETDDLAGPESARRRWRSPREDVIATFRSAARTTEQKLPEYARRRGLALFVRTSTKEQADSGTRGSPTAQLEAGYDDAARLGVARDEVKLIDAWGEAGTRKAKRKKFRELRALVRSGGVGVVIAPEHHRISRNVSDAEAFFQECADMRVLLLINGQPFDPRVPTDRYMLGMMAQFAQYENDARVRWLMRGKLQRAKNLAARYRLPAGLVWASPDDPAYVQAAHNAGLGHYLRRTRDHSAKSPTAHLTLYVLPFPDAEVEACARLRVQWLLEPGGSVARVLERINTKGSGWPRRRLGLVPKPLGGSRWRADQSYAAASSWEKATAAKLADYLASPSLYGRYTFYMESLADDGEERPARRRGTHGSFYPAARARTFAPLPDAPALLAAGAPRVAGSPSGDR
jgi:DNA invertase Pin-like site-specific DNA recombinase